MNIFINDIPVEALDPFLQEHAGHQDYMLDARTLSSVSSRDNSCKGESGITLNMNGQLMKVRMHILPKLETNDPMFKKASGPKGWNQQQGVYFYRLDRIVQAGGWCNLIKPDEHVKLARLSIDVNRNWDQLIELTATKNRIIIPESPASSPTSLRKDLRTIFGKLRTKARDVYEGKKSGDSSPKGGGSSKNPDGSGGDGGDGSKISPPTGAPGGGSSNPDPEPDSPDTGPQRHKLDEKTIERLLEACQDREEKAVLMKIYNRARRAE